MHKLGHLFRSFVRQREGFTGIGSFGVWPAKWLSGHVTHGEKYTGQSRVTGAPGVPRPFLLWVGKTGRRGPSITGWGRQGARAPTPPGGKDTVPGPLPHWVGGDRVPGPGPSPTRCGPWAQRPKEPSPACLAREVVIYTFKWLREIRTTAFPNPAPGAGNLRSRRARASGRVAAVTRAGSPRPGEAPRTAYPLCVGGLGRRWGSRLGRSLEGRSTGAGAARGRQAPCEGSRRPRPDGGAGKSRRWRGRCLRAVRKATCPRIARACAGRTTASG